MPDISIEDALAHYGVRGMKWGVRKNLKVRSPGAEREAFLERKDKKWVEKAKANPQLEKMSRIAAKDSRRQLKQLKKEYKAAGHNVKRAGLQKTRYDNEVAAVLQSSLERASHKVHGRSNSGLLQVTVSRNPNGSINAKVGEATSQRLTRAQNNIAKYDAKRAKRSANHNLIRDVLDVNFNPVNTLHPTAVYRVQRRRDIQLVSRSISRGINLALEQSDSTDDYLAHVAGTIDDVDGYVGVLLEDEDGFFVDLVTPFDSANVDDGDEDDELAQTALALTDVNDVIAHYGVRGMKWGVRRDRSGGSSSSSLDPSDPPSKKLAAKSSSLQREVSNDAMVFNELRAKAKRSGIEALSNDDIRALTARASAIDQYSRAFPGPVPKKSKKRKLAEFIVNDVLINAGRQQLTKGTNMVFEKAMTDALLKKGLINPKEKEKKDKDNSNNPPSGTP